jgi:uncharacterized membrane protein
VSLNETGIARAQGGGGYPPGGYGPPGGGSPPGGYGPPGGGYPPPGGGGYGPPGGGYPPPGAGSPFGGFVPPAYGGPQQPLDGPPIFSPVDAVSFGWTAVTKNFASVALPIVLAALVAALPAIVLGVIRGFVLGLLGPRLDAGSRMAISAGGQGITQLIAMPVQAYMLGGINHFALRVCRGERPELNAVFGGGPFFLPMLGGQLLYTFGAAAGLVLCVVPGVILTCGWLFYQQFIVDKGLGPIEALTASWRATTGQRLNVFVYLLLNMAVIVAGFAAFCVGALLISAPVIAIANVYLYLKLTGEQPRLAV